MIVFDKQSWHYRLIRYTFGESFFLDYSEVDWEKTESQPGDTKNFQIFHKSKPKTVNLCPYCRGVVAGVIALPFVFIYKLFPHKPKKQMTHQQIMKNMKFRSNIIRVAAGSINIGLGIRNLYLDEPVAAAVQFAVGIVIMTMHLWLKPFALGIMSLMLFLKLIHKEKPKKAKEQKVKNPSLLLTKLNAEHDKICPPIFFIDKKSEDQLT